MATIGQDGRDRRIRRHFSCIVYLAMTSAACFGTGWRPRSVEAAMTRRLRAIERGFWKCNQLSPVWTPAPFVNDAKAMIAGKVAHAKCAIAAGGVAHSLHSAIRSAHQAGVFDDALRKSVSKVNKDANSGKHVCSLQQLKWADDHRKNGQWEDLVDDGEFLVNDLSLMWPVVSPIPALSENEEYMRKHGTYVFDDVFDGPVPMLPPAAPPPLLNAKEIHASSDMGHVCDSTANKSCCEVAVQTSCEQGTQTESVVILCDASRLPCCEAGGGQLSLDASTQTHYERLQEHVLCLDSLLAPSPVSASFAWCRVPDLVTSGDLLHDFVWKFETITYQCTDVSWLSSTPTPTPAPVPLFTPTPTPLPSPPPARTPSPAPSPSL